VQTRLSFCLQIAVAQAVEPHPLTDTAAMATAVLGQLAPGLYLVYFVKVEFTPSLYAGNTNTTDNPVNGTDGGGKMQPGRVDNLSSK